MAKGGGKGAGAKAAKAAHEDEVKAQKEKQKEDAEAAKWSTGAKANKGQDKAEKAAALKAEKAERERLLAEEYAKADSGSSGKKVAGKTTSAKVEKKAPATATKSTKPGPSKVPEFAAQNIDDILDVLDIANSDDEAKLGAKAAKIVDAHPERRFKAAFEAYKEAELPKARKEHPGLRLQQYHDLLYKQFQKHPDNPFNQLTVAYDATKEVKVEALKAKKKEIEERLKA